VILYYLIDEDKTMNKKIKTIWFSLILTAAPAMTLFPSELAVMEGLIYRQDSVEEDLMYIQREFREEIPGGMRISHIYYHENGSVAAYEKVTLMNGEIVYYETVFNDLSVAGSISLEEDGFSLSLEEKGKTKDRQVNFRDGLMAGPMLPSFIRENRETLLRGEPVEFLLPYFDKMVLVPFKLVRKRGAEVENGEVVIQMKLKNFLLGMLIEPIDFVMDTETGRIRKIHGQTILPEPGHTGRGNGKLLSADIFYSYGGSL